MTLRCESLTVAPGGTEILSELDLALDPDRFTVLVGPNGSGKSTLLLAAARVHAAAGGAVLLDGSPVHRMPTVEVARKLAILPQSAPTPDGLSVRALAAFGRYPHLGRLRGMQPEDHAAIERALELTGTVELADRAVDTLSGGERQRAWIASAIAQRTRWLLLDEPTTYLDIGHQTEVLRLLRHLHDEHEVAVLAVLHDLGQAAQYADRIVVLDEGVVVADGDPALVLTPGLVLDVFGADVDVVAHPRTGRPVVVPAP